MTPVRTMRDSRFGAHARCTLAIATAVVMLGCSQQGKTNRSEEKSTSPSNPAQPVTTVAASTLREQALELIETLSQSTDPQVRANAVEAAGKAQPRLKGIVEGGLRDNNAGVRAVAATVIGKQKISGLAERCRALLDDSSTSVRLAAIFALAANGKQIDPSPIADLLLADPSLQVRSQAAFILGELKNTSSQPLLRQAARDVPATFANDQVKIFHLQVAEALIKLGDDSQRTSVRAALYPNRPEELESTALAAQILGQVQDRKAADQLIALVDYKDSTGSHHPAEIRLAATGALGELGIRGGTPIPTQYVTNTAPAIRAQCAFVFGSLGGSESLSQLQILLNDTSEMVRISAADGVLRAQGR